MHMHEGKRRILELSLWPFVEQSIEDLLHRLQAKLLITVQSLLIKIILFSVDLHPIRLVPDMTRTPRWQQVNLHLVVMLNESFENLCFFFLNAVALGE